MISKPDLRTVKISDRKGKPQNIQIRHGDLQGLTCSSVTADTFPISPGPGTAWELQFPECFARCPSPAALRPHRNSAMAFHSKNTLLSDCNMNNAHPKLRNIAVQHRTFSNSQYNWSHRPRPQMTKIYLCMEDFKYPQIYIWHKCVYNIQETITLKII